MARFTRAILHHGRYNLDSIRALNLAMPWVAVVDLDDGAGYSLTFDTPYDAQLTLAAGGGLRSPLVAWNAEMGRFGYAQLVTCTLIEKKKTQKH
jgi:hypothetical protein